MTLKMWRRAMRGVFFFQAEDGIRDLTVTGVQTCALPISVVRDRARELRELGDAKARAHRGRRCGQRADGVVSGRGAGRLEVLTEDYLSVYLPVADWDGRPRFDITVR